MMSKRIAPKIVCGGLTMKCMKWIIPAILVLSLFACAKPPQAEIDAAKAQVAKAAQDPDVIAYAPETLKRAEEALGKMQAELSAKHYDKVKAFASEAQSAAIAAFADAKTGKERVKGQAEALIASVKKALPDAEKTLASAKRIKPAKLDLVAASKGIADAKAELAGAEKAYADGNYIVARDQAQDAQTRIADVVKRISEAVQAATRKK
ncbi:MAG TPA: DUF4398 domain-containing protein [Spirochaetales bacterium]|nr:DUF4398 domain-containing protein [Spirochaetales bacterium]HRY52975.1 DUF4398 domain-containing protein [Spirochaetia bacterium]